MSPTTIHHNPRACRQALAGATTAIIDLETSGLKRHDRIVSAGVLVAGSIFILFLRSQHASVRNLSIEEFRWALEPLTRPDLVTVYHNAGFDLGHLHREGVQVGGTVHCTLQQLRLCDQDRGGDGTAVFRRRRDRRAGPDDPQFTDYRLKHCVPMLCGLSMLDNPGPIAALPYRDHVRYLASDLLGTRALYEYLVTRLDSDPGLRAYYDRLGAPLLPLLVGMTEHGIRADVGHLRAEIGRLEAILTGLEARHVAEYGASIASNPEVARWLWGTLGLRSLPGHQVRQGGRRVPSLKAAHLISLAQRHTGNHRIAGSLASIVSHRRALDLRAKLGGLLRSVSGDGRIHTSLSDRQATGRITSDKPNLQALGKEITVTGCDPPRNALVADPGHVLVTLDLAQADIRVLAHAVATFPHAHRAHLHRLRGERLQTLAGEPWFRALHAALPRHRNPQYRPPPRPPAPRAFDPLQGSSLARAFHASTADFYTIAATAMLGAPPKDKRERNFCKQTLLGLVNGMGPTSLARRLGCDVATAKEYQARFALAYANETAFRRLMVGQITLTGQVTTFMGRERTDTAQRWLVTLPRLTLKISYKRSDRYWLDVTPLEPRARVLTCYIHRAWDAQNGALIYDANRGCTTGRDYRLYDTTFLEFRLPYRNLAWRSIRRVRAEGEEAQYRGLDSVTRALFNAVCQGGTADLTKIMMLGSGPLCTRFGARLLLQIHDELVFQVPSDRVAEFVGQAMVVLPGLVPDFAVPIILEPKVGTRFGELVGVKCPRGPYCEPFIYGQPSDGQVQ
jgi:DNA polymerase I-like protein with 3'-5' exonuclease and polymerase domains